MKQKRHRSSSPELLARGVWQAPYFGPDGEMVLLAVDRNHRLVAPPTIVPNDIADSTAAVRLKVQLDTVDPMPDLRVI